MNHNGGERDGLNGLSKMAGSECRRLRVLLVANSMHWVSGTFANQLAVCNPGLDTLICSRFALRRFMKRFGDLSVPFDIVHFLGQSSTRYFIGYFYKRVPVVTTIHHVESEICTEGVHNCDAVMTVSSPWHRHLIEMGIPESKLVMVPMGVDTKQFHKPQGDERLAIRAQLGLPPEAFVVGFSGKVTSDTSNRKGIDVFLHAIKELHKRLPKIATLIIGPGWQEFVESQRKAGIPCVHVPFTIDHHKVADLYRALDVYWVTSRIEGGPVPLLEAMASGVSCVTTPVGAVLDLIEDQRNGFVVGFDRPDQFVDLTLRLAKEDGLRRQVGDKARSTIVTRRQWMHTLPKVQDLYRTGIKNFQIRTNTPSSQKDSNWVRPWGQQQAMDSSICDMISPRLSSWMRACEYLQGSRMMMELGEWRMAIQMGCRVFSTAPLHPMLWWQTVSNLVRGGKKVLVAKRSRHGVENTKWQA